ncbi:MAG: Na+/H+ antiporter NhaA [Planctomycetes bacterium]|nr:Na+/H+ antiporter NhaA [Planctomycetota bacterium]
MSHDAKPSKTPRPIRFLFENSVFLIAGAIGALLWANTDPDVRNPAGEITHHGSYNSFVHHRLFGGDEHGDGHSHEAGLHPDEHPTHNSHIDAHPSAAEHGDVHAKTSHDHADATPAALAHVDPAAPSGFFGNIIDKLVNRPMPNANGTIERHGITIHFLINDVLMALFFAIAAKEVWESLLPGGALSNPRKAATPLLATLGGILGPAGLYLLGMMLFSSPNAAGVRELAPGWAIPCATDIAFSYLVARLIFGSGHPAIAFLLLLAIADDAAGLVILAVAYPSKPLELQWLLITAVAMAMAYGLRKMRVQSFWAYLLVPGVLSWISFDLAGIHAALGLVPIIPLLPHAHTDLGIFAREELNRHDTLNEFEHWWKNPVELVLGVFGLANAGVVLSSIGVGTWLVVIGLLIGKPLGITALTWVAQKVFKLEMPKGMGYRHIITLGTIASIGFTVALFVSTAAFRTPGPVQDSVKMGALLSFFGAVAAFIVAKALGIRPLGAVDSTQVSELDVDDEGSTKSVEMAEVDR